MEALFITPWCVGVAAWLYTSFYWYREWKGERGHEYKHRTKIGCAIFLVAWAASHQE